MHCIYPLQHHTNCLTFKKDPISTIIVFDKRTFDFQKFIPWNFGRPPRVLLFNCRLGLPNLTFCQRGGGNVQNAPWDVLLHRLCPLQSLFIHSSIPPVLSSFFTRKWHHHIAGIVWRESSFWPKLCILITQFTTEFYLQKRVSLCSGSDSDVIVPVMLCDGMWQCVTIALFGVGVSPVSQVFDGREAPHKIWGYPAPSGCLASLLENNTALFMGGRVWYSL